MKKKISKIISIILTLCLLIGVNFNYADAASNHLLIVNTKKNTLGYYVDRQLVKIFKIASGKSSTPTPTGKTKIVNKIKNRPYYSGGIPGGSPNNPLGDRWLGLHLKGTYGTTYGIHGNNNESSIGKHVSGGCIRMHNSEIRWLFDKVPTGTDVIIKSTDQTDQQIASGYNINLITEKPGWKKENNKWYYIKQDGKYQKNGWLLIDSKYYYFDANGAMKTGWHKENEKWYYLESNGAMTKGWKKLSDKWYYFENNGEARIGWKKLDGKWYYFEQDTSMRTGWKMINNKWYYFYESGMMATNTVIDGWTINNEGIATK